MKKLKKIPLRVWLFYLLLLSTLLTGISYASYRSESSGGSSVRVALFANDASIDLSVTDFYPGKTVELPITVTNYDDENVCEVSQSYEMQASAFVGRIPLEIKWKTNGSILPGNASGNFFVSEGRTHDDYFLVVSWPINAGYPDAEFADEIEVIRINVRCEQID